MSKCDCKIVEDTAYQISYPNLYTVRRIQFCPLHTRAESIAAERDALLARIVELERVVRDLQTEGSNSNCWCIQYKDSAIHGRHEKACVAARTALAGSSEAGEGE